MGSWEVLALGQVIARVIYGFLPAEVASGNTGRAGNASAVNSLTSIQFKVFI